MLIHLIRSVRREPLHIAISALCLALGLASCLLIVRYVAAEHSYDDHWPASDRLVRLVSTEATEDGVRDHAAAPLAWGPALKQQRPEVKEFVRIDPFPSWVSYGDDSVRKGTGEDRDDGTHLSGSRVKARLMYADRSVLDVFSLDLLRGNPTSVLQNDYDILMTESFAREHFGNKNPIGETFKLSSRVDGFEVVGVVEDIPANSHFSADLIIPHSAWRLDTWVDWSSIYSIYTYLLLDEASSRSTLRSALPAFLSENGPTDLSSSFSADVQLVSNIHLHSDRTGEIQKGGDSQTVVVLTVVAIIILLLGCVNFVNLAMAQATDRQQEIGVRKVLGANRKNLVWQFLAEAFLVSLISTVCAVLFASLALPFLSSFANVHLSLWHGLSPLFIVLGFVGIVAGMTILAGSYPAFGLSRFRPARALAGHVPGARAGYVRDGLIIAQFTIAIVLVIGTIGMYAQVDLMTSANPGFTKDQVVVLPISGHGQNTNFDRSIRAFKRQPGVLKVATTGRVPGERDRHRTLRRAETRDHIDASLLFAGPNFGQTMGIDLVAGAWFRNRVVDRDRPVVLNETAVRRLGFTSAQDAIGTVIERMHRSIPDSVYARGQVKGVVRDFTWSSFREETPAMVITPGRIKYMFDHWVIRTRPTADHETLAALEATWKDMAFYPEMYTFSFLADDWSALYTSERDLQRVIGIFAVLAVLIACLGLFGLAAFTARRRTKEIGIRKALGATIASIIRLLSTGFLLRVGIASLLALPVAYVGLNVWLQQFANRITPPVWIFATAVGMAGLLAMLTISSQALRAARRDPATTLRDE